MLHKWVINPSSRFPLLPLPLPQAGKRGKKVSCWVLSPSFWQWLCSLLGHQDRSVGRKGWKAGGQRLGDFAARQALYYKPRRSLSLALARRPTGSGNQLLSRQTTQRPRVPAFCAGSSLGGWSPEEVNSAGTPTSPSRQTMRRVPSCRLSGPSAVTAARAGVGRGPGRTAKLAPAGDSVERLLALCPLPLPPLPRNPSVAPVRERPALSPRATLLDVVFQRLPSAKTA